MTIASKVERFLAERAVDYEEVIHPRTMSAAGSAEASHIPAHYIVKAVLLKNAPGYLLALLPATHRIVFTDLREILGPDVEMAGEPETEAVFPDCESRKSASRPEIIVH